MLGVQSFLLLDEDECRTGAESNNENDQSYKEAYEAVAHEKISKLMQTDTQLQRQVKEIQDQLKV